MGGYKTDKRNRILYDFHYNRISPSGVATNYDSKVLAPQTTYSYRSKEAPPESDVSATDIYLGRAYATGYDNGHEFSTKKFLAHSSGSSLRDFTRWNELGSYAGNRTNGDVVPTQFMTDCSNANTILPIPSFNSTLYGNRAIAGTAPTKSVGDLSTFFGEFLRDGLPSVPGFSFRNSNGDTRSLRGVGSEYLNLQFGFGPLIEDIKKAAKIVQGSYKILEQYQRDAGHHVRRAMSFPDVVSTAEVTPTSFTTYVAPSGDPARGISDFKIQQVSRQEIWFKGAYTYHIPVGKDLLSSAKRFAVLADHLLGIKLTPDRLWNLAPWSWLADWHSEIGTALQARSLLSYDNQILQYGYLMRKTTVSRVYTGSVRLTKGDARTNVYSQLSVIQKERVRASPFGFGIKDTALKPDQYAILGALGISLGDGQLRRHGY